VKRAGVKLPKAQSQYVRAALSGYSLRVGAAQDLTKAQVDSATITRGAGWKSERMLNRYTENLAAADSLLVEHFEARRNKFCPRYPHSPSFTSEPIACVTCPCGSRRRLATWPAVPVLPAPMPLEPQGMRSTGRLCQLRPYPPVLRAVPGRCHKRGSRTRWYRPRA
jgi:hypothetical protein